MFAFDDYRNLEQIELPNSIVSIRESSFNGCDRLEGITLPSKTISIGIAAFSGCSKLVHINLDAAITSIEVAAFHACVNLETPSIYNTKIEVVQGNSFLGCIQFQMVEVPSSVKLVEDQAFGHCTALSVLIFNSDQLTIEDGAFANCENVRKLIFTKGKPASIGNALFGETERTSDGKGFIVHYYEESDKTIPYPTLYYTAAYAKEWAPNGETEWNGYTIQQISQEELDALLAEARGEANPVFTGTPAQTASPTTAPEPTATSPDKNEPDQATSPVVEILLLSAIAAVAVGLAVFVLARKRKNVK
jgi:hypothetical protein